MNILQLGITKEEEELACQMILENRKVLISSITKSEIGSQHWYVTCVARIKEHADGIKNIDVADATKQQWLDDIYSTAQELLNVKIGF